LRTGNQQWQGSSAYIRRRLRPTHSAFVIRPSFCEVTTGCSRSSEETIEADLSQDRHASCRQKTVSTLNIDTYHRYHYLSFSYKTETLHADSPKSVHMYLSTDK